ncbi:TIGR03089 family protein [Kineococcus indalonis]|uniref:TIGR03089 family protein n=1 Tax=Kineococcus indalonis TaxID=2696566 RepID=UPI001412EB4D|nr:TIGR03089 family protein [Kineococcus indalonis]NAZ88735.1 TIGR03089 family protein [Kineococcus indalonis]
MPPSTPRSVTALLQTLVAGDPTAPRLTFYGEGYAGTGERVELSARVLANWVAKTANLLEEEFDAGPGTRVALDLPAHWRTLVWQLAVLSTGAHALTGAHADADVLVSADAGALAAAGAGDRVAVSLAPLATSFGAPVPAGALDYARVVTGYGDVHAPVAEPAPGDGALDSLAHGSLLAGAVAAGAAWPVGVRLLTDVGPADAVRGPLAAWCRGGSVVLTPDLAALPEAVAAQERVDARLPRG